MTFGKYSCSFWVVSVNLSSRFLSLSHHFSLPLQLGSHEQYRKKGMLHHDISIYNLRTAATKKAGLSVSSSISSWPRCQQTGISPIKSDRARYRSWLKTTCTILSVRTASITSSSRTYTVQSGMASAMTKASKCHAPRGMRRMFCTRVGQDLGLK